MNNKKKVLVTGASGFIGSAIVEQLNQSGYKVTSSTRNRFQYKNDGFIFIDLLKPETIIGLSDNHKFNTIVHFGSQIGWNDKEAKTMLMTNVISTSLLASEAKKMNAKIIFASAAIVHGAFKENIDIDSIVDPDTLYTKSKWLAEELIRMSSANHCILRLGGVFGFNGPTHLGLNRSISDVLNNISPKIYGNGRIKRNYIYVWDVAKMIEFIIDNNLEGVHLLAGTECSTINSMINKICKVFSNDISPITISGDKARDQFIQSSKVFPERISFEDALKDLKLRAGKN